MQKKETKELRALGRRLAQEIPKKTLEQVRGGKISTKVGPVDTPDVGP